MAPHIKHTTSFFCVYCVLIASFVKSLSFSRYNGFNCERRNMGSTKLNRDLIISSSVLSFLVLFWVCCQRKVKNRNILKQSTPWLIVTQTCYVVNVFLSYKTEMVVMYYSSIKVPCFKLFFQVFQFVCSSIMKHSANSRIRKLPTKYESSRATLRLVY